MAISDFNIIGGLKRIYLVASVVWMLLFGYAIYINLEDKFSGIKNISKNSCEELHQKYLSEGDFEITSIDDSPKLFFYDGTISNSIPYSKHLNNSNYDLYNNYKDECYSRTVRSLVQRIKYSSNSMLALYLIFIPIPLYLIIVFIVRGFVKNRNNKI